MAVIVKDSAPPKPIDPRLAHSLERGDLLVSKTAAKPLPTQATSADKKAFTLPYEARFIDNAGKLRTISIIAELPRGGLRFVTEANAFAGHMVVGLQDRDTPTASDDLPSAVELLVTGPFDEIAPELLQIKKLGKWHPVKLSAASPLDSINVKLRANIDPAGLELPVPITRPRLLLTISPPSLQGFGLESGTVTVRADGLLNPQGRSVTVTRSKGGLSSNNVTLDAAGVGTLDLRSSGVGKATVSAISPPLLAADAAQVPYTWPLPFLGFAMAGGATGSFIAYVRKRPKGTPPWQEILAGILLGFVTAVAAAFGVDLTGAAFPTFFTEAAVFVAAGLGALSLSGPLASMTSRQPSKGAAE